MSLGPQFTCSTCDGALIKGPAKCRCPLPERDDIPVLTRVNDEWVIERARHVLTDRIVKARTA